MKNRFLSLTTLAIVAMLTLSACSGLNALPAAVQTSPQMTPAPEVNTPVPAAPIVQTQGTSSSGAGSLAAYNGTLENIYTSINPEVVNIQVVQKQAATQSNSVPSLPFFNLPGAPQSPNTPNQTPQFSAALGSGFVWSTDGYIVTNNHVVDGADSIEVTFSDGTTVPAKLVGQDAAADLAVIKVDLPASSLHPVTIANSDQIKVGEMVIAIGNPFGLQGTMTTGIVSAIGRMISADQQTQSGATYSIPDVIQTDAAINPGNSGGVLLNDQGQVIGVTSAIQSPVRANAGIGFAIPSNIVQMVVPALIKNGHFEHPYLGISGTTLNPDLNKAMNLPENQRGALVIDVTPNSPADKAGLQGSSIKATIFGQDTRVGGDVITAVDGNTIHTMDELIAYLFDHATVGQKITLTVLRRGKEQSVEVTLEARPNSQQLPQTQTASSGQAYLGLSGTTLDPSLNKALGLPQNTQGVMIEHIQSGSPAQKSGLQGSFKPALVNGQVLSLGGDIIEAIDGQPVATINDIGSILSQYNPGDQVTLQILRNGQPMEVKVVLGERPTG